MTQITQEDRATVRTVKTIADRMKDKVAQNIILQSLNVEMVEPGLLKPNPYNPNKQSEDEFALLRQSIKSDGFTMPILTNKDLTIIDGEHRWRAAIANGLKLVPVVRLDLDETRMKMATIRHNKATGSHDAGLEALVLADLEKLVGAKFIETELLINLDELQEILNFTNAPDALAGEEFGSSWSPVKNDSMFDLNDKGEPEARPTFKMRQTVDSAIVLRSSTSEANMLAYQKIVKKDKDAGMQNLYTISAVFNPEEALCVQSYLENPALEGQTPAEKLFFVAKAKAEQENEEEDERF